MSIETGLDAYCEMFRAWNRLEPRTRIVDFDEALQCQVHDPLWMLSRQWQFGEFKGEDTGSAIFAKAQIQTTNITKYQLPGGTPQNLNEQLPLEVLVESEKVSISYKLRMQGADQFFKLLDYYGNTFNQGTPDFPYDKREYKSLLIASFPFEIPQIDLEHDTDLVVVEKSEILVNEKLKQLLHNLALRSFDAYKFYQYLLTEAVASRLDMLILETSESHSSFLNQAVNDFITWWQKELQLPANKQNSAWNPCQLEYQFNCSLPSSEGGNTVLCAEEYYTGTLDWYSFDLKPIAESPREMQESDAEELSRAIKTETFTFIPTAAEYPGMPKPRWFEFEDGKVDLGNINADTTDIAKIILSEFALIYGNDWFVLPYPVPIGSLIELKGIVVTDVFGQKTLINTLDQGKKDDWTTWGLFNLSPQKSDPQASLPADCRLFVPPVLPKVQESEILEEIYVIRDEMSNMVWAIESKIRDLLDKGMDAHSSATSLLNFLRELEGESPQLQLSEEAQAELSYVLGNTVPENWIPFIPVHLINQNRSIQLQRASMPRLFRDNYEAVRPRTGIMRVGIQEDPAQEILPFVNPSSQIQNAPYYIYEEEIPKAGLRLTARNQRARWYNGATFNWFGYQKSLGRGGGASGLKFDTIKSRKESN